MNALQFQATSRAMRCAGEAFHARCVRGDARAAAFAAEGYRFFRAIAAVAGGAATLQIGRVG